MQPHGQAATLLAKHGMAWLVASFVMLNFLSLATATAQTAGNPASGEETPAFLRKLTEEGVAALSAGRLPQARQKLEQAYVSWPSLDGLFRLGRVAEAQKNSISAADYYRRYLAAAGQDVDEQAKASLRQYITSLKEPTAEVDVASGDGGALLRLDGEVAGFLPLSGPLLVKAGEHSFTLEKDGQKFQTSSQSLSSGQRAQLQVSLESRYAVLTLTPALLLLVEPSDLDDEVQRQLFTGVAEAVQKEHSFLIDREQTRAALIKSAVSRRFACAGDLRCQESLARQVDATGVLRLLAQTTESGIRLVSVQLLDVPTGAVIDEADKVCISCPAIEMKNDLLQATRKLLRTASTRGRGTLNVASTIAGAKVLIDGRELGVIPFTREVFEGLHEVSVQRDGYILQKRTAKVMRGQVAEVRTALLKIREPISTQPVRPRSQLIIGGILVGVGLLVPALGAIAIARQGSCVLCYSTYAEVIGSGLAGTGAVLIIGGTVLVTLPAK